MPKYLYIRTWGQDAEQDYEDDAADEGGGDAEGVRVAVPETAQASHVLFPLASPPRKGPLTYLEFLALLLASPRTIKTSCSSGCNMIWLAGESGVGPG